MAELPPLVGSSSGLPSTIRTKTTDYTAVDGDFVLADATDGAFTITLPTTGNVIVKKTDASANAIAVAGTIDGDAGGVSIEDQNFGAIFKSTATNAWRVVSITSAPPGADGADGADAPAPGPVTLLDASWTPPGLAWETATKAWYQVRAGHVHLGGRIRILSPAAESIANTSGPLFLIPTPLLPTLPGGGDLWFMTMIYNRGTSKGFMGSLSISDAYNEVYSVSGSNNDPAVTIGAVTLDFYLDGVSWPYDPDA